MTNVTCGLTVKEPGSPPCPTHVIEYETALLCYLFSGHKQTQMTNLRKIGRFRRRKLKRFYFGRKTGRLKHPAISTCHATYFIGRWNSAEKIAQFCHPSDTRHTVSESVYVQTVRWRNFSPLTKFTQSYRQINGMGSLTGLTVSS